MFGSLACLSDLVWFYSCFVMAGVCYSGEATGHKDLPGSSCWASVRPGGEDIYVQCSLAEL